MKINVLVCTRIVINLINYVIEKKKTIKIIQGQCHIQGKRGQQRFKHGEYSYRSARTPISGQFMPTVLKATGLTNILICGIAFIP